MLFQAIKYDSDHGISANRLASMTSGVVSRPVLSRILNAVQAKANAVKALKEHGRHSYVDVGIAGGSGWGANHAYLHLALDPIEVGPSVRETLFADVVALGSAGLSLSGATEGAFWDGDELAISVLGTA